MQLESLPANSLVNVYLIASYMYYIKDEWYISDSQYDQCCKLLDEKWDLIDHQHKHIIDRASLSATTGFTLKESDYPLIVKHAARFANKSTTHKPIQHRTL